MIKNIILVLILASVILLPTVYSQTPEDAAIALNISEQHIKEMSEAGFGVERVSDLLSEAREIFKAQNALEEAGGSPDYSLIADKTDLIRELKNRAFNIDDEIKALEARIEEVEGVNITKINPFLEQAKTEFRNERYEQAKAKIEEAYEKISEEQAVSIKVVAFFDAGRRTIVDFIFTNWQVLLTAALTIIILSFFFKNELSRYLIKREMRRLKLEKGVILDLIKKLQYQYFEVGNVPSVSYNSKLKKFEEMIRDINRRLPLLRADLEGKQHGILKKLTKK